MIGSFRLLAVMDFAREPQQPTISSQSGQKPASPTYPTYPESPFKTEMIGDMETPQRFSTFRRR